MSKPDPGFFDHVIEAVPYAAEEILYIGDRLDNDIKPTAEAGMATALIRRGPWGVIQEHEPEADEIGTTRISSLAQHHRRRDKQAGADPVLGRTLLQHSQDSDVETGRRLALRDEQQKGVDLARDLLELVSASRAVGRMATHEPATRRRPLP